jgi:isocitrate/isopropylmalate dehydrogenase
MVYLLTVDVKFNTMIVDNTGLRLVNRSTQFNIIVTWPPITNFFKIEDFL